MQHPSHGPAGQAADAASTGKREAGDTADGASASKSRRLGQEAPPVDDSSSEASEASEYQDTLPNPKLCTPRLRGRKASLVRAVNEDHFAMLNDSDRNQFFWKALEALPVKGKRVLDVGAGTGLLSLMAARLGASHVDAIDGSRELTELVSEGAEHNGLSERVRVIAGRSTGVSLPEAELADVIVSETFGVLLLQEDCLASLAHARQCLAKPGARIIPAGGAQYVMLVMSPSLRAVSGAQVPNPMGVELSHVGELQQTARTSFSTPGGFCLNSLPESTPMSERACICSIDFHSALPADIPQQSSVVVTALQDGHVDAVVSSWEAWAGEDRGLLMSTHAEDTRRHPWGFARDAHWGQGIQLVEEHGLERPGQAPASPTPLVVRKGERLRLVVCFDQGRNIYQVIVEREAAPSVVNAGGVVAEASPGSPKAARPEAKGSDDAVKWEASSMSADIGIPALCDVPDLLASDDPDQPDSAVPYGESLPKGFWCPPHLRHLRQNLVDAINDDYFALLNDSDHGAFFAGAIEAAVGGRRVLDLGAGAGMLSVLAARRGAKHVLALECSSELARLAQVTVERNDVVGKVQVVHGLSSCLSVPDDQRADVILCEPYDAFLLGQGPGESLAYLEDARHRLARPGASVIPAGGAQHAVLISSPVLGARAMVSSHDAARVDLSNLGALLDTGTVMSTRDKGFRLSSLPDLTYMSERVSLFSLDFHIATKKSIPRKQSVTMTALDDGRIDAVVTSWDMWADKDRTRFLVAHAEDTRSEPWGLARDVVHGQGIQLLEDFDAMKRCDARASPAPFLVKKGEELQLTMHVSLHRDSIHFTLRRQSSVAEAQAMQPRRGKVARSRCA